MSELFLKLVNMSITASWIAAAVILFRIIFQKFRIPKYINCILWSLVGIRLVFPFSFESIFSLIPSNETIPEEIITGNTFDINTGINRIDDRINNYLDDRYYEGITIPMDTGSDLINILSVIWLLGVAVMLLYTIISYLRLYCRVGISIHYKDNIYLCDSIDTPFILGVFLPCIYLPSGIEKTQAEHVIAHEQAHLKRKDYLIKPLGFLILTAYWFNPVIWAAYILLCRDIELACDEKVVRDMNAEDKKAYSTALLACSLQRTLPKYLITACPLAFGEVGVKQRIRSVLNYKKPAFWVIVAAVILCITMSVCFLTDPVGKKLTDIDVWTENLLENPEAITVDIFSVSYRYTEQTDIDALIGELQKLRLESKEISQSLSEDRDASIKITLEPDGNILCFNADCSEVWINNSVKPSYTYRVKNPKILTKSIYISSANSFSMFGKRWSLQTAQQNSDGTVIGCGESIKDQYPDAEVYDLSASVYDSFFYLTLTDTDKQYSFDYSLYSENRDSAIYTLTSKKSKKQYLATVGNTYHDNGKVYFTLIISFDDYVLTFSRYNNIESAGGSEALTNTAGVYHVAEIMYGKQNESIAKQRYTIFDNGLFSTGSSASAMSSSIGYLFRSELTEQNFDLLFTDDTLWQTDIPPINFAKRKMTKKCTKAPAFLMAGAFGFYIRNLLYRTRTVPAPRFFPVPS